MTGRWTGWRQGCVRAARALRGHCPGLRPAPAEPSRQPRVQPGQLCHSTHPDRAQEYRTVRATHVSDKAQAQKVLCNKAAHEPASGAWPVFCPHTEGLSPNPAEPAHEMRPCPKHSLRPQAGERQRILTPPRSPPPPQRTALSPGRGERHCRSHPRPPAPSPTPAALSWPGCGAHRGPRGRRAATGTARPRRARAGRAATTAPPSWSARRARANARGRSRGRGRGRSRGLGTAAPGAVQGAGPGAGPGRLRGRGTAAPGRPLTAADTPQAKGAVENLRTRTLQAEHSTHGARERQAIKNERMYKIRKQKLKAPCSFWHVEQKAFPALAPSMFGFFSFSFRSRR